MKQIGQKKNKRYVIDFFLDEEKMTIVTKCGDKTTTASRISNVQGRKAVSGRELGIKNNGKKVDWVEVPGTVIAAFENAKTEFDVKNVKLRFGDKSMSSGMTYYSLDRALPKTVWAKIKQYFEYFNPHDYDNDEADGMYGDQITGWVTASPNAVEVALNITGERTLEHRREVAAREAAGRKQIDEELNELLSEIDAAFENGEYIDHGMTRVEGDTVQHPKNPKNIWGGGKWWVIQAEYVWEITNNGMDGDDWSRNNIETGGAGAVGIRISYNEKLAELIRTTKK